MVSGFIPPYLLRRIAAATSDSRAARSCQNTLQIDEQLRDRRTAARSERPRLAATASRVIHDAANTEQLPGRVARSDGDPPTGDDAVDEAFDWSDRTLQLYATEFGRRSFDDRGSTVSATVHYSRDYDNAFWDGTQLVFGDGDGRVFERFTKPVDVFAHEFTHGVTQYSAGLVYAGQPGALNESMSDVFGSMVKQYTLGQTAEDADWLIGQGIFLPSVRGVALRSMLRPGTAYDDPVLGKDPQVASMADYVDTDDDNGGVHINSGIPNRAFALLATQLGGTSWDRAGRIWYTALTSGAVNANTDFAGFAEATMTAARQLYPGEAEVADDVRQSWQSVGLLGSIDALVASPATGARSEGTTELISVRRSGGFAGVSRTYQLDLRSEREGSPVRELLASVERQRGFGAQPTPPTSGDGADRFVYSISYGERELLVGEVELTPELDQLIQLVLARGEEISR
jgi:Zn-dependent metalloprotease